MKKTSIYETVTTLTISYQVDEQYRTLDTLHHIAMKIIYSVSLFCLVNKETY